ncbi:hypothetical protein DPMN_186882 [Dreissena polymorpha]|uniref:Uncharacterized protein n=1 Tax=Dreissena polymorpha TaxID=45954 RepID=A0A9D4DP31_DREPO|nr:hypothetical protein DPMN_186882 [Dreissena polymorpha]
MVAEAEEFYKKTFAHKHNLKRHSKQHIDSQRDCKAWEMKKNIHKNTNVLTWVSLK